MLLFYKLLIRFTFADYWNIGSLNIISTAKTPQAIRNNIAQEGTIQNTGKLIENALWRFDIIIRTFFHGRERHTICPLLFFK